MLVACGAGSGNPFTSFEARCTALPAPRFEVVEVPVSYVEDRTQSIDALTARSGDAPETRLTLGLTTAKFGHETDFELRAVDDPEGGRTCGVGSVYVELSMQPVIVFTADELSATACGRAATFRHEMKHVAVFRQTLADATRELRSELADKLGGGVRRASSRAELERQFKAAVQDYLGAFIRRWHGILDQRNTAVDTPQEYTEVRQACP
jgi:hypothetical protein